MLIPVVALPHRLWRALPPSSSLRDIHMPSRIALFSQPSAALASITSPYTLTRREMLSSRKSLTVARDHAARRIGLVSDLGVQSSSPSDLLSETGRIHGVVCEVLEVPPPASPPPSRRSRSSITTPPASASHTPATPTAMLAILSMHLPRARSSISSTLNDHSRPSALTRLWFPLLFLPPALWTVVQAVSRKQQWMKEQVRNARETLKGFVVQWVWEPLEGIGKTLRGGGEGLGVAPTTVKSDQEVCLACLCLRRD